MRLAQLSELLLAGTRMSVWLRRLHGPKAGEAKAYSFWQEEATYLAQVAGGTKYESTIVRASIDLRLSAGRGWPAPRRRPSGFYAGRRTLVRRCQATMKYMRRFQPPSPLGQSPAAWRLRPVVHSEPFERKIRRTRDVSCAITE